ncbi:MAG: adenylate/guanylate cyclase domain-containing protein [Flavobacterium sp.]|nr:adenylate/guanylate cyclase domain-containing protein [Flavobacterium sp.]
MLFTSKKNYILVVSFLLCMQTIFAQDSKLGDSLQIVYDANKLSGVDQLELLRNLSFNKISNKSESIKYANELIKLSAESKNYLYLYRGYSLRGQAYSFAGDISLALESFIKGSEVASKLDDKSYEGGAFLTIADVYSKIGNSNNADFYYLKSIEILRKTNDSISLASALLNAGDEAFKNNQFQKSLSYFKESRLIFKKIDYPMGVAYNLGNEGMVYAEQGKDKLAEQYINQALVVLEEFEDYNAITTYLTYMSDIYLRRENFPVALKYAHRSLELATEHKLKEQISDANLTLSNLYEKSGNTKESYKHYKDYIAYRDSIINIDNVQQIADLRTNFEVSQKQTEVDLLEQKRKNQRIVTYAIGAALFFIALLAFLWYRRYLFIRKTKQIIEKERDRSDSLLLNILPEETAIELKLNGNVKAKKHDAVTVLFSDFKGFTSYSEKLSPEELVKTVDFYFSKFDTIMEDYGLEKIKTIGDAYMCAGGLNGNQKEAAHNMILAAKDIIDFVEKTKTNNITQEFTFDIRIGINTGPVVAGVVGSKKFAYDIWGDTVNIASRMESMSQPGKINISEGTHALISDQWTCDYRGEIEVKNRGILKMYFVND